MGGLWHCFTVLLTLPSGYSTVRHGKSPFSIGKPSISIRVQGHLYHGELLVITRGYIPTIFWGWNPQGKHSSAFSAASSTFSDFTCEGFRVAARKSVSWILASCWWGFGVEKNAAKMLQFRKNSEEPSDFARYPYFLAKLRLGCHPSWLWSNLNP